MGDFGERAQRELHEEQHQVRQLVVHGVVQMVRTCIVEDEVDVQVFCLEIRTLAGYEVSRLLPNGLKSVVRLLGEDHPVNQLSVERIFGRKLLCGQLQKLSPALWLHAVQRGVVVLLKPREKVFRVAKQPRKEEHVFFERLAQEREPHSELALLETT